MFGIQAERAAEYSKKTFELEQRRNLDTQLLNSISETRKESMRIIVSRFDINRWFEKVNPKFVEYSNSTKRIYMNSYRCGPGHFCIQNVDDLDSFLFCYFLLPKLKRFFRKYEGYSVADVLDDDNQIVLKVIGTKPLKWYERIIYCS